MTSLAINVTLTALGWLVLAGGFVFVLRARWLARFRAGFLVSMLVAMMGVALMSASVVGVWGFEAAKRLLRQELEVELQDVGGIVKDQIGRDLSGFSSGLDGLGASLVPLVESHAPMTELQNRLEAIRSFNPRFLQLAVFDLDARPLTAAAQDGEREDASRVAIAFSLDGKPFISEPFYSRSHKHRVVLVALPLRAGNGPVRGVIAGWYDLESQLMALLANARFNQSGYAVMVDADGRILAHPDPTRVGEDVSAYPAVQQARQTEQAGWISAVNAKHQLRLFSFRHVPNPATLAKQSWILLTEIDEGEQLALLRSLRLELAVGVAIVLVACLIVAQQVSRSIQEPLETLGAFARRIGTGDLTGSAALAGRDVVGELASSLNSMTAGLQERDRVKEVFGRYVATQVSSKILDGQVNLGGESRRVTILFSDIRSFTSMSEQMSPAQVVTFLNDYFSEMVDAVFEQNGMLDKFMGDGLMAVFGAFEDAVDHPRRAVLAALRMQALLAKINGERAMSGKPAIAIGIGIHSDEVVVGNIGSRKRLEFTVVGDGVNVSSRLQALNKEFGTTILVSETTHEAIKDEFECRQMPETPLRGKRKELRFYEVLSLKAAAHS